MVKAVRHFRRERAGVICIFGFAGENFGNYQSVRCGRQNDFPAKMDFRFNLFTACRANQRLADVRRQHHSPVAFFDVAFIPKANFY